MFKHGDKVMWGEGEFTYCCEHPFIETSSIVAFPEGGPIDAPTEALTLKPRTIMIGDIEVPEPVREPLEHGQVYYLVHVSQARVSPQRWFCHDSEKDIVRHGLVQLTEEGAELQLKATLKLYGGEI